MDLKLLGKSSALKIIISDINHESWSVFAEKGLYSSGLSIKHVSSEEYGGGYQTWNFEAIFRAKTGTTGGGRGSRNLKLGETSFMDAP